LDKLKSFWEKQKEYIIPPKRAILYALVVVVLILADQAVKEYARICMEAGRSFVLIPHVVEFVYVENTGAAFGMLGGMRILLVSISVIAMLLIGFVIYVGYFKSWITVWSLVFVLGGAIGNLIDRALCGYVVDMFNLLFMDFAVFNVADIFVTCGAVVLCVSLLFSKEGRENDEI